MTIYYIRHGDPIYNPDSLTDYGFKQAEMMKEKLKDVHFDRIYTSTSNRAILTGAPTAKDKGIVPERLDWANEDVLWRSFSIEEGNSKQWAFFSQTYGPLFASKELYVLGNTWYNHPAFARTKFKEGMINFQKAQDQFFEELGYIHDRANMRYIQKRKNDDTIAIFAHGGCGICFLSSMLDIPTPYFATRFEPHTTCGMTVIELAEKDGKCIPKIIKYNESLEQN